MIPFQSQEAKRLNTEIFKLIETKSYQASKELALLLGEAPILKAMVGETQRLMPSLPQPHLHLFLVKSRKALNQSGQIVTLKTLRR